MLLIAAVIMVLVGSARVRGGEDFPGDDVPLPDWLVTDITTPTQLVKTPRGTLSLNNGLVSREFTLTPDFGTVDYYSMERDCSLLRAISPEAVIALDGVHYNISGLYSTIFRGYLNRTALAGDMHVNPNAFHFTKYEVKKPEAPFKYTPARGAPKDIVWPPKGLRLDVEFEAPKTAPVSHRQVKVTLHYEMYDGIPLMAKWLSVNTAASGDTLKLSVISVEYLAVNRPWAPDGLSPSLGPTLGTAMRAPVGGYSWLFAETDHAHSATVYWELDPLHDMMPGAFVPSLNASYATIPTLPLDEQGFESYKVHELLVGSSDKERFGLARRRKLRLLAPHTQESPIVFHTKNASTPAVRALIDQLAATGFEMMLFKDQHHFDMESVNETYINQIAADVEYAKKKGIELGGYDLVSLARTSNINPKWIATPDKGHKPQGACFASGWYDYLLQRILNFMNKTGLTMMATDGPYKGYICASKDHSHHADRQDSVYQQDRLQSEFYRILREKGVYIKQPDKYFYQGANIASESSYTLHSVQEQIPLMCYSHS